MKLKKVLCCLCAIMFAVGVLCTNATAASTIPVPSGLIIIDNDALTSSGYWNTSSANKFTTYLEADYLYNQDARMAKSREGGEYAYNHSDRTVGTKFYAVVGAYLNHNDFRDPSANYHVIEKNIYINAGCINQADAPGGWSYLTTRTVTDFASMSGRGVRVLPSGVRSCGADAISIQYWRY